MQYDDIVDVLLENVVNIHQKVDLEVLDLVHLDINPNYQLMVFDH